MQEPADLFEAYYTEKLWSVLPEVYRTLDGDDGTGDGPLRELVARIGRQAAIVRRSIDRLWDDQSIETCDDWVIPYIGDLVATNVVADLDGRGQRLDVAKTIYYRRRKGTVAMLEELAGDITGWRVRVVEMFRRLERARHGLDPPIGLPSGAADPAGARRLQVAEQLVGSFTGTPAGGTADLRDHHGALRAHTPFDEYFHTADVRRGGETTGWHGIPRLAVFLWRLRSYGVPLTTPVAVDPAGCPGHFTFDPTGRETPLFAAGTRPESGTPDEWQLPVPISATLLRRRTGELYPGSLTVERKVGLFYDPFDASAVTIHPELGRFKAPTGADVRVTYHYGFSADIGAGTYDRRRYARPGDAPASPARRTISGGGSNLKGPLAATTTDTLVIADSLTYTELEAVPGVADGRIAGADGERPVIRVGPGDEWELNGGGPTSRLRLENLLLTGVDVVLRGTFERVQIASCTLDPGQAGPGAVLFAKSVDGRDLRPSRVIVEGAVGSLEIDRSIVGGVRTRAAGRVARMRLRDSIVQATPTANTTPLEIPHVKDPMRLVLRLAAGADPVSAHLQTQLQASTLTAVKAYSTAAGPPSKTLLTAVTDDLKAVIDNPSLYDAKRFAQVALTPATLSLAGSGATGAALHRLNRTLLEEAFPLELADLAFGGISGELRLERCTVLGRGHAHRLWASECILDDIVVVEDAQAGCVRFTAWSDGSVLPRRYESVRIEPGAPLFRTRVYGRPDYAQLLSTVDEAILGVPRDGSIAAGGPAGSELGAFAGERNPIRLRSLGIKLAEFTPVGITPVIVTVT